MSTMADTVDAVATTAAIMADGAHGEVYVARKDGTILVFSRTSTGNVAPVRTLSGLSMIVRHPSGIASCC